VKAIFILLLGVYALSGHSQERPNIIFIMADDLGYGDIEPFGQKLIKTPNLVRMEREGIKFTNHYAGTSVCAPSRCVLMTGLHSGHTEIRGNLQNEKANGQLPISDTTVTVAELLRDAGYATGMIGKWGLGDIGTSGDPTKQGFDFFYGYTDQVLAHNHFPEYLYRNTKKEKLKNKVTYLDKNGWHKGLGSVTEEKREFADELFMKEALKFITAHRSKNFFLYLPFIIPHVNDEAPKGFQYETPSQRDYASKPWSKDEKDYAAAISYLDEYVGNVLDHLKKLNLDKNTLVIFTSDNGPRVDSLRFNSSGSLRGFKRDLYEGGIRAPFIAWWPGTIDAGSVSHHVSGFWDFLPTVCSLAGITKYYKSDGISFLPALLGKGEQPQHDHLYFEFHEGIGSQAARRGNWKAVIRGIKTKDPFPIELYNLEKDPFEKNDVAHEFPDKAEELRWIMLQAHTRSAVFQFYSEQ
jgi:arylsulfatase A-like enzyme